MAHSTCYVHATLQGGCFAPFLLCVRNSTPSISVEFIHDCFVLCDQYLRTCLSKEQAQIMTQDPKLLKGAFRTEVCNFNQILYVRT